MKSGDLNRYVAIEENVAAASDYGDKGPQNWTQVGEKVWCSIVASTARIFETEAATKSGATHTIRMRFYPGFKPSYRINDVDNGQIFEVLGFWNVDQRGKETHIIARLGVSP